jgi:hypothetical protein
VSASPSGCHHCGIRERLHFDRWSGKVGWHTYVPPTDEQIKTRMLRRRTAKTGANRG